jgi:hypothetical protein
MITFRIVAPRARTGGARAHLQRFCVAVFALIW